MQSTSEINVAWKIFLRHVFFIFWLALAGDWEDKGKHWLERRVAITRIFIFQMLTHGNIFSHVTTLLVYRVHHPTTLSPIRKIK